MKVKKEIRVTLLQSLAAHRENLARGKKQIPSHSAQKESTFPTPRFQVSSLQNCEAMHLYCSIKNGDPGPNIS